MSWWDAMLSWIDRHLVPARPQGSSQEEIEELQATKQDAIDAVQKLKASGSAALRVADRWEAMSTRSWEGLEHRG